MAVLSKEPLKTKRSKCSCGGSVRHYQNRFSTLTVYTEDGPVRCKHLEFRCIKCLRGYYFGYSSDVRGKDVDALEDSNKRAYKKLYEEDCLEQEVLVTSRQTGFSVKFLYQMSLDILYLYGTFSGMAKKYVAYHLGGFSDLELDAAKDSKERIEVCEKRMTSGWFTYSLVELKQRYRIEGPISSNIDEALSDYHCEIRDGFYIFWGRHKCQKAGCGSVFVIDGGMKAQRKICGAVKSGVRVFEHSKTTLVTGCTSHPGDSKYCKEHKDQHHPAVTSAKLSRENRNTLESVKESQKNYKEQDFSDNIYVVEEIKDSKLDDGVEHYLIRWEGYEEETWEPSSNIPEFMVTYYKKTGNGTVPTPRVAGVRKKGTTLQYQLVWEGDDNLTEWVPEKDIFDLNDAEVPTTGESRSCNTRKDRDRRKNRHTCGIFIGCWPCGVCLLFEELFGSESISQVYAIILEFLATLDKADRDKIEYILYDDMCHLGPYGKNVLKKNKTELTEFFHSRKLAVDFLHFKNHVGVNCRKLYDPRKHEDLKPVNSVCCEQQFRVTNHHSNVKAMNESRYNMFWIYVLDMHNHHSIGDIRHAINPTSPYRIQMIVDSAIAASIVAKDHVAAKEAVGVEIPLPDGASGDEVPRVDGAGGSEVPREDELASLLSVMDIGHESEDASLNKYCICTRKCATKKCPCFSSNRVCNELCHKHNNNCTNY